MEYLGAGLARDLAQVVSEPIREACRGWGSRQMKRFPATAGVSGRIRTYRQQEAPHQST